MVKIGRPFSGLIILTVKMRASHCHLFVFGQESGFWLTCLCERICFAEAAWFDLRIICDGCEEENVKKEICGECQVSYKNSGLFLGKYVESGMVWAILIPRDAGDVLKQAICLVLYVFCTWNSSNFE